MALSHLASAKDRLAGIRATGADSVLVSLSGKDSLATLHLASSSFRHVEAFHLYLVRGLETVEGPLARACVRYGIPLHYLPSPGLCRLMKHAVFRLHVRSMMRNPKIRLRDCWERIREITGIQWILCGERMADSFPRRLFWRGLDGIDHEHMRAAPICDWTLPDVEKFSRINGLVKPCRFGSDKKSSGLSLSPACLRWLQKNAPRDLAKILAVFPGAASNL